MKRRCLVLATSVALGACASAAPSAPSAPPPPLPQPSSDTSGWPGPVGAEVAVVGRFAGFAGRCRGGPPVSRGDWMLEADAGCVYVNGPVPSGHSVTDPGATRHLSVTVRGVVRQDAGGRRYLELAR